ncbi:MFS transporter [Nocardioides ungokensis]|uniref:MFS transporter n=1 Tax=Nocardioides ungokensis TaxID=1643322 RepID=UPI001FE2A185|nr:MFS transporter [Nocardioides ungokensis]
MDRQDTLATGTARATGGILLTLASAQFLMTLDSSVMNVSMATVAQDLGTSITGIQTAITLYTLVMATLMITGGKIGSNIGRLRAFSIGCVVYGAGSFVTGIAQNLTVLIIGWSFLEGMGAALIMPAIVALVATNFEVAGRPRAYGLVAAAGACAVAVGPLIGGAATTYASWRLVFFGEVVIVALILLMSRKIGDAPVVEKASLDLVGTLLSVVGLGMAVYGVLRTSEWGFVRPKPDAPALLNLSASFWLILAGLIVVWVFFRWEAHVLRAGRDPLVRPSMFANTQLDGGLVMFSFQFLLQAGVFFVVPLFLSVALGVSAIETGLRVMPLSVGLLAAAMGVPKLLPDVSPRRVVRVGILLMLAGIVILMSAIDANADATVVSWPMLVIGLGMGCLASQLGSVTASSVPTEESSDVGGLQNTATNLGASLGTALAGSVMIAALTSSLISGLEANPDVPDNVASQASVDLASGVPFLSDKQVESAMADRGASGQATQIAVDENAAARIDGLDAALGVLAMIALVSLFFSGRIPDVQPGSSRGSAAPETTEASEV